MDRVLHGEPLLPRWLTKPVTIAIATGVIGFLGAWSVGVGRNASVALAENNVQDVQIAEQARRTDEVVAQLKDINLTLGVIRDLIARPGQIKYIYIPVKAEEKPRPKTDDEVLNGG